MRAPASMRRPLKLEIRVNYFSVKLSRMLLALAGTLCLAQTPPVSFTITTVAGNGTSGFTGDGAVATNAELALPTQVWWAGGNAYIADENNNRIRELSGGNINTIAGDGTAGNNGTDGNPIDLEFDGPAGIAVDSKNNIYVSDTGNNLLWKISGGVMNSIVGVGGTLAYGLEPGRPGAGSLRQRIHRRLRRGFRRTGLDQQQRHRHRHAHSRHWQPGPERGGWTGR